jgi:ketosteroid isomerase-like protein
MSEQNVAVMKEAFEAAGREGLDAFIGFMADDLVHRAIVGAPDDHGPIHGPDEMKAYLGEWYEMFDDFKIVPTEFIDAGADDVIVVVTFGGRAKGSDAEISQGASILYTLRDGKIVRGREFATREEAVAAAAE